VHFVDHFTVDKFALWSKQKTKVGGIVFTPWQHISEILVVVVAKP